MQEVVVYKYERPEVEVVSDAAFLVVDGRMLFQFFSFKRVVVAVDHSGVSVACHSQHSFESRRPYVEFSGLGQYE